MKSQSSLIEKGLIYHFFNAVANNNLSMAMLIWSEPVFQQVISRKNAKVRIGGNSERWDVVLPKAFFSVVRANMLPNTPETYKFMLLLPGMDILIPSQYEPYSTFEDDALKHLRQRSNAIKDVPGLERIYDGLQQTIEMVEQRIYESDDEYL
jgi:hypothetical protein